MNKLLPLQRFRQDLYESLGPARDALFELTDAVLTTPAAPSFAHLSLAPLFRRRWPSLYEALGDPPRDELLRLALRYVPGAAIDEPVLIGDHTAWPRLWASRLAERTYEHHPTRAQRVSQGEPITRGLGYTTLALAAEPTTPWVLPLLHERIEPSSSPLESAAEALRRVCQELQRQGAGVPITLWDSEYGCAPFVEMTHDVPCSKLMRLRSNRCLYGAPPEYQGRGRPCRHGPAFKLKDESTWPEPEKVAYFYDAQWVYLRRWRGLHFRKAPDRELTLVCVERERAPGTRRHPRLMWLAWVGAGAEPSLRRLWQLYTRRFSIESTRGAFRSSISTVWPRGVSTGRCLGSRRWSNRTGGAACWCRC